MHLITVHLQFYSDKMISRTKRNWTEEFANGKSRYSLYPSIDLLPSCFSRDHSSS